MRKLVPHGAEERYIETASGPLRALHAGTNVSGQLPLVLVHGGGSDNSAISWYRLIVPLSLDREVWAIDLPGFGGSIDVDPVGGPKALATILAEALDSVSAKPAIVFGVSMGGDVALNLALDHPEHVAGLGSGLIDQSQKMIVAAMQMAEKKVCAHRSYRVAMRRQSLSLPNMVSILWRWR